MKTGPGRALAAALGWGLLAAGFAWSRAPYDDEWFSLTVAREIDAGRLIPTLASDVHPPWIALLDRLLARFAADPHAFMLARLVPSLLAVLLLSIVATRRLRLRWPQLAALHPVVFMYAVSARWYSFLFLAQALRAWALWGTQDSGKRRLAFAAGGILGPMAGYADLLFLAHDSIWLVWREREGRRLRSLSLAGLLALANGFVFWRSPLFPEHRWLYKAGPGAHFAPGNAVEFLATGLVGQAFLPGLAMMLALLALPGFALAAKRLLQEARTRQLAAWLALTLAIWCLLAAAGAASMSQPRYALMVWLLSTAAVAALAQQTGHGRIFALMTLGYLSVALGLTMSQRYFLRGDLNRLPSSACRVLIGDKLPDLIVAPYPKTAWEISQRCAPAAPIVSVSWAAHEGMETGDELAEIIQALSGRRDVLLITLPARGASLQPTNAAVQALMTSKCSLVSSVQAVEDPHYALKAAFAAGVTNWRFKAERWACGS